MITPHKEGCVVHHLISSRARTSNSKRIHATFAVGDQMLSGSDAMPGQYLKPQGFHIQLNLKEAAEAERIFMALAENGSIQVELLQTFWALRYGSLVDQFGAPWEINCEKGN